jgi:glycine C-acetyltransferase
MPDQLQFMREGLAALQAMGLDLDCPVVSSATDAHMVVNGKRVLNLASNNYLGLANHAELKEAAKRAIDRWGAGAGAVRYVAGTQDLHLELERRLAQFKGTEAAMFAQTGVVANLSALVALAGSEDVIFSDRLNHASIIDGAQLSRARVVVYEHCDVLDLQARIREHLPGHRRGLIVTDGVFSMDGDIAPLDQLHQVAGDNGLLLMVDDAHGDGVLGHGRGIAHHFGLQGRIDVEVGTLSKAFGVIGGVIAGKRLVVDYIRAGGRASQYSTGTTPADTAACLAALDLLERSTALVDRLWENTRYFRNGMRALGFQLGNTETPILPVLLGEADLAKRFARRLFEEGVFAVAQAFPLVPRGQARIRLIVSAVHERRDLDFALSVFAAVGRELGVIGAGS